MDNNFRKCPFCGKKLPIEETFCPYCVHKIEVDGKREAEENNRNGKKRHLNIKIIAVVFLLVLTIIGIFCIFISKTPKGKNNKENDSLNDYEFGVMYGKLSQYDNNSGYADNQKNALKYFDNNYMSLFSHEFLVRYPDIFENTQVKFEAVVEKIVNMDKEKFTILVKWDETYQGRKDEKLDSYIILEGKTENISVAGNVPNGTRVVEGDHIYVYAEFLYLENYTIDQIIYNVPKCQVNQIILNDNNTKMNERYNKDYLLDYAKKLFGTEVTIRDAEFGKDFIFDELHYPEYKFLICELSGVADNRFQSFEIYQQGGCIRQSGSIKDDDIIIRAAADGKHFFRIELNKNTKNMNISYYEDINHVIWDRTIDNITEGKYDFTVSNMYVATDDTLYIINNDTGENVYEPVVIGQNDGIFKTYDGIIIYSDDAGCFKKYDIKGNFIWKSDVVGDKFIVSNMQVTDDKLILHLYAGTKKEDMMAVIKLENGELLNSVHSLISK